MKMREISPREIPGNWIERIADEWMLITAGTPEKYNMMTASWGGVGEMWGKDVAMAVVRPQRYTRTFLDAEDRFSLSFYGERKDIHKICGSQSGRDIDKTAATGLTPIFADGTVYFEEAKLTVVCRKLFVQPMDPLGIIDPDIEKWYSQKDYHILYVGEIEKVLVQE